MTKKLTKRDAQIVSMIDVADVSHNEASETRDMIEIVAHDFAETSETDDLEAKIDAFIERANVIFDARVAFETAHKSAASLFDKLAKSRKFFTNRHVAKFCVDYAITLDFVNRQETSAKRFNIYAINKVEDVISSCRMHSACKNAINFAIVSTLFALDAAKLRDKMTHVLAKVCASDKETLADISLRRYLTRHTVSTSTSSTQASSTINALQVLNVVKSSRDANNVECFNLQDNALVSLMRECHATD